MANGEIVNNMAEEIKIKGVTIKENNKVKITSKSGEIIEGTVLKISKPTPDSDGTLELRKSNKRPTVVYFESIQKIAITAANGNYILINDTNNITEIESVDDFDLFGKRISVKGTYTFTYNNEDGEEKQVTGELKEINRAAVTSELNSNIVVRYAEKNITINIDDILPWKPKRIDLVSTGTFNESPKSALLTENVQQPSLYVSNTEEPSSHSLLTGKLTDYTISPIPTVTTLGQPKPTINNYKKPDRIVTNMIPCIEVDLIYIDPEDDDEENIVSVPIHPCDIVSFVIRKSETKVKNITGRIQEFKPEGNETIIIVDVSERYINRSKKIRMSEIEFLEVIERVK